MKAKGKPTKKKPAKKRPSRKQQSKKTSPQKQRLQDELVRLLPEVEEEGLIFLLKQAQVLIHNLQVDRINREVEELEQTQPSTTRAAPSPAAYRRAARGAAVVDIEEAANGKSFYLVFPDTRKILGLEEMRLLVRACYEPKRKSEALNRMYRWMQRERRDILSDGTIGSNSSRLLEAIFHRIREKYTLKE